MRKAARKAVAGAVLAEGREEGGLGVVEEVENAFLERQAGPEDRGDHERGVAGRDAGDAEGRDDVFLGVGQFLGEFIGKDFADAFEVGPETETVFLDGGIPHLCDEIVENGMGFRINIRNTNIGIYSDLQTLSSWNE